MFSWLGQRGKRRERRIQEVVADVVVGGFQGHPIPEVLENGISNILRPSQRDVMSRLLIWGFDRPPRVSNLSWIRPSISTLMVEPNSKQLNLVHSEIFSFLGAALKEKLSFKSCQNIWVAKALMSSYILSHKKYSKHRAQIPWES